jgi:hypothetical protein
VSLVRAEGVLGLSLHVLNAYLPSFCAIIVINILIMNAIIEVSHRTMVVIKEKAAAAKTIWAA